MSSMKKAHYCTYQNDFQLPNYITRRTFKNVYFYKLVIKIKLLCKVNVLEFIDIPEIVIFV